MESLKFRLTLRIFCLSQSLQSSSYNHFSAIYYLLLERVREHRAQQLSRQCGSWSQRPRSTSDSSGTEVRPPSASSDLRFVFVGRSV